MHGLFEQLGLRFQVQPQFDATGTVVGAASDLDQAAA